MPIQLYNPFENLNFNNETCFLSGENIDPEQNTTVFPRWILDRYSLHDKKFTLMDQITSFRYEDLKVPCSENVIEKAIDPLEEEIKTAFDAGYEEVIKIPKLRLFQWMSKLVFGVLYHDLLAERKRSERRKTEFKLSPILIKKFSHFHLMLQSLIAPIEFSGVKPWSIYIFKSKISKDVFNYKDEPTNLNFSLSMQDFGIVACLQDNGAVGKYQQEIIEKLSDKTLHPVQLEEIFARFIYTNYLLKKHADYNIKWEEEKIFVESLPLIDTENNPLFGKWDDDMFAQVLADYWKPWGLTKNEIYQFPNSPVSFLVDEFNHQIIEPDSITLPF